MGWMPVPEQAELESEKLKLEIEQLRLGMELAVLQEKRDQRKFVIRMVLISLFIISCLVFTVLLMIDLIKR
jgi:hypothetical protein